MQVFDPTSELARAVTPFLDETQLPVAVEVEEAPEAIEAISEHSVDDVDGLI
jgi:hypothetical protein